MQNLVAFILFVTTHVPVMCRKDEIFWYLQREPIILGADVHLICNITCCIKDVDSVAIWSTENGVEKSLSHNILPTNNSKYDILTSRNGCQLVIKDFQLEDANKNYICTYNFQRYSKNLTLNQHSFEYQPTPDLIKITKKTNDGFYHTSVNISKAYPQPHCSAFFNADNITSKMQTESEKIGGFYVTRLHIQFFIVVGTFNLTCDIGSKVHRLVDKEFINLDEDVNPATIILAVVVLVLLVFLVLLIIKLVRSNSCSKENELELVRIDEIRENDSSEETNRLFIENENNKESYFERSIDCLHKQVKDTIKEMTRKRCNTE